MAAAAAALPRAQRDQARPSGVAPFLLHLVKESKWERRSVVFAQVVARALLVMHDWTVWGETVLQMCLIFGMQDRL
uniref:Uncharacterized protein n=1 Tax=Hyaloperonospora arabidopsidis (strain Emoy2) TaxID=559515 RepID=M4B6A2_HYAAE